MTSGPQGKPGPRGERGLPKSQARAVVYLFVVNLLLIGLAYLAISHSVAASNHRWCAVLVTLDNADRQGARPTSATGRRLFADFHMLREQFGCK